ncbi:MAG TPA: TonB-dependent receptor, partial [Burkholderiaceae bacterium]|nr:TonB-dependent receptor [Burkholderiaceae bacterium]
MRSGPSSSLAPSLSALACAALAGAVQAQPATPTEAGALQPVVITGSAPDRQRWVAPASIDIVDGDELRAGQLQINLSEGLGRVPGLVIQNRQNYAQDLQISIRGFGARSTFGVRGVRLFVDGIPASAPDGQGQAANFPLGSAERIEVIRGPYSALYGASAGGVIALYTQDGQRPTTWRTGAAAGADGLWRLSTQVSGQTGAQGDPGGYSYVLDVGSFATDGARPQSAAERSTANLKLSRNYDDGRVVLVFNRQFGDAQDPLGLTRAEFDANPGQTTTAATQFNTRKSVSQSQLGLALQHRLGGGHRLELMGYGGTRAVAQFQAITTGAQIPPGSAGGVIALDREYSGVNARWRLDRQYDTGRLTLAAGLASDRQSEQRRGYENFIGSVLGVQGRLRRDETNRARTLDPYAQAEWDTPDWTFTAGVRHSRVRFDSADRYIVPGNPDDSGSVRYSGTSPVLGIRWRLADQLQAYASAGRGFETPTLNEAAYQASGLTGLNTRLAAGKSRSVEAGLRGRHGQGAWTATVFDIRTQDEIVVLSNTGGRSTFQNAGRTLRRGLEFSGDLQLGTLTVSSALTLMNATYADGFLTCAGTPCAAPTVPVQAGNRLPGLPRSQAFVQLAWEPRWAKGSTFTLEARHSGGVMVNDRNTDRTGRNTIFNLGARFQ